MSEPQTKEQAMAGQSGVDFLPDDKCHICGAVPWWTGRKFVVEHVPARHALFDGEVAAEGHARSAARERRGLERPGAAIHYPVAPARRPARDDED